MTDAAGGLVHDDIRRRHEGQEFAPVEVYEKVYVCMSLVKSRAYKDE